MTNSIYNPFGVGGYCAYPQWQTPVYPSTFSWPTTTSNSWGGFGLAMSGFTAMAPAWPFAAGFALGAAPVVGTYGRWADTIRSAAQSPDSMAALSAWRAGAQNLCGMFLGSWGMNATQWHRLRDPNYRPVGIQSPTTERRPEPPLPDILTRAKTYYDYRQTPDKYDEVLANKMNAAHPEARNISEGRVASMVEDLEKKDHGGHKLDGREALLKMFARNTHQILSSVDPAIREDLLAQHQTLKIRHNLVNPDGTTRALEPKYITDDVAADMLLVLLGRSEKANQQSSGALREFLNARGLATDNEDEIGAKGVLLLKDYFGDQWRNVLQMFYQNTVNDAGRLTEFPDYNDAATLQHKLIDKKHFRAEVAAVIGNYGATYPYERVARVLKQIKDIKTIKTDDSRQVVGEQEFNAYLNTILLLRGYTKADIESNRELTIMQAATGTGDNKQHRFRMYIPDLRNPQRVAQYLHRFMDRLVEIEQLRAKHHSAHSEKWQDAYDKDLKNLLKRYRREDKNFAKGQ